MVISRTITSELPKKMIEEEDGFDESDDPYEVF